MVMSFERTCSIVAEGLLRGVPIFARFLDASTLSDGAVVNDSNIARECGVSVPTVKSHFEILVDTPIGSWLPAYTRRPKRRVIQAPKFYFGDTGVVNHLTRRGRIVPGGELYGKALEGWVHHELRSRLLRHDTPVQLTYWRLTRAPKWTSSSTISVSRSRSRPVPRSSTTI